MRVLVVTAVAAERDAVCAAAESCDEATLPGGYPLRRVPAGRWRSMCWPPVSARPPRPPARPPR